MFDPLAMLVIHGRSISPGLAEGRTFLHRDPFRVTETPVAIEQQNVEQEVGQLESATATISGDLMALATRVEQEMDANLAAVFEAHKQMLNDPELKNELQTEIRDKQISARSAVKAVFLRWEKRFLQMESQMAKHKGADMRDLSKRLSNALAGIKVHPLEQLPPGAVLVTSHLLPSDTIFLSQCSAAAVLLEHGRAGSHAALFMRAMGIPCITAIRSIFKTVPADTWVLVDGDLGEVIVRPHKEHKTSFQNKFADQRKTFAAAQARAQEPATTRDGVAIPVLANVGCREDTERAMANGAEGVGLYRTELAYLGRMDPPNADELLAEMRRTLEPAKGKPVCVRLMDIGADKNPPFIGFLSESNPALGCRGIRLLIEHPRLMETQLRAILQLADDFDVCILVPMVTLPGDVAIVRENLARLVAERGRGTVPKLGAMIETPAAALTVRNLEPLVDFLSFGTNDLAQYAFAADRENAAVEAYFNDSDDAIFRLLRIAHEDAPRLPLTICGELAGRAVHVPRLLSGIRTLSVVPPLVPFIKEAVRAAHAG